MDNQENNPPSTNDDVAVQQENPTAQRSKPFYRKRTYRRKRETTDDNTQQLNVTDEQNHQDNNKISMNNTKARGGRGGIRRGRGRGQFFGGYIPVHVNYMQEPEGFYDPPHHGQHALWEQEGWNPNFTGNSRGGRQRNRLTKTENPEDMKNSVHHQQTRSNRRRHRNTKANKNNAETDERLRSDSIPKPKDDEAIVRILIRNLVSKVARRLARKNRQQTRATTKQIVEKKTDVHHSQLQGRPPIDYNDPYVSGLSLSYYNMYYGDRERQWSTRGRGRGHSRQQKEAHEHNQPEDKKKKGKDAGETSVGQDDSRSEITVQVTL